MFASPEWLLVPYVVNIFILVPVCCSMLIGNGVGSVFNGRVTGSEGLRLLIGSLWLAILVTSIVGLFRPSFSHLLSSYR